MQRTSPSERRLGNEKTEDGKKIYSSIDSRETQVVLGVPSSGERNGSSGGRQVVTTEQIRE